MKKEKIYPCYTLYTNEINLTDDDLNAYNKDNGTNITDIYELLDIIHEQEEMDFLDNLHYCEFNKDKFVIFGTVGRWNGRHVIRPVVCDGLEKAIKKAIGECTYLTITVKNGAIHVTGSHHDGTNYLTIKKLNERGINCKRGDLEKPIYHERIKGYLW